ncbi:MAG: hypothetical protein JNL13_09670 [Chitinophagaceae bacterium]|nr:hypothetical protein [Chitinophagaceae bacterium]
MFRKILLSLAGLLPLTAHAQLNLSINGGYTWHSGEHHAAYADKLLDSSTYNPKKIITFSSSFKLGYAFRHLNLGLGLELGNYQTKKETEISGLSAFISSTSFVAATGRYLSPHLFAQYQTNIGRRFTFQAGLMTGILFSGFEKDNGIIVIQTDAIAGIIPAQTFALEAHTGKIGKTVSKNIVSGAQLAFGYNATERLNINLEFAARWSSVDARASVTGYEQPFSYSLFYMPLRAGITYAFVPRTQKTAKDQ